jgi:hypothetical protein
VAVRVNPKEIPYKTYIKMQTKRMHFSSILLARGTKKPV